MKYKVLFPPEADQPLAENPKDYKLKAEHGFTLIETLIYIAIIGGVVAGFVAFSISVSNGRNKNYVAQEVQANNRVVLNMITQKIQAASSVNIGASTFGSDPGVLSLAMSDVSKNPTIISLSADDGVLQITEGIASALTVTSDEVKVTNLVFTNLTGTNDRENIKIEMTTEYDSTDDVEYDFAQSIQTTVTLRQ